MGKLTLPWHYGGDGSDDAYVIVNDVLYKIPYVPNSEAEAIMNEHAPLPTLAGAAGILVAADGTPQPLTAEEVASLKAKVYLDAAGWEKNEADLDAQYEREAAEAVATPEFQSLPLVPADEGRHYLKAPRSGSEVRNLLAARGLPHVVQLVGRTADKLVLVRAGEDLARRWLFRTDEAYPPPATHRLWAAQLADALAALHARGIAHRDITTFNALVDGDTATLCDLEAGPTSKPVVAPEVVVHGDGAFTYKADVWAFGILLWSITQRNSPRPHAARYFAREGQFAELIDRCLQLDPAKRPTAAEIAEALRQDD